MALRLARKINCLLLQNVKSLSTKVSEAVKTPQLAASTNEEVKAKNVVGSKRYTIAQPQVRPFQQSVSMSEIQMAAQNMRKTVAEQHLQPAMLPDYFQPRVDLSKPYPNHKENRVDDNGYRRFADSKTVLSINSPLKISKLANPFPDPVKVMPSHKVSDQEKADLMLAESRGGITKCSSGEQQKPFNPLGQQVRSYSRKCKKKKCPKKKKKKGKKKKYKQKCKKFTKCPGPVLRNCDLSTNKSCDKFKHRDCCKTEAPYPSYSELCAEPLPDPTSECDMCPWKPDDNPNFKPKRKYYHTTTTHNQANKNRQQENTQKKQKTAQLDHNQYKQYKDDLEVADLGGIPTETAYCGDLRKRPCKRPKNRMCKRMKKYQKKQQKKRKRRRSKRSKKGKKKGKKGKKKGKRKGKKAMPWVQAVRACVIANNPSVVDASKMLETGEWLELSKDKKIRKFPFHPKYQIPLKKERQEVGGHCRKRKKPKLIKDCPPDCPPRKCALSLTAAVEEEWEDLTSKTDKNEMLAAKKKKGKKKKKGGKKGGKKKGKKGKKGKKKRRSKGKKKRKKGKKRRKCKKFKLPKRKGRKKDDPCDIKPKPGSRICPSNVFKKKKKRQWKRPPCKTESTSNIPVPLQTPTTSRPQQIPTAATIEKPKV